jgi:hypothetical protein
MKIHATARKFAIQHQINLGRMENGYYYIAGTRSLSMGDTAKSALAMMRRYLEAVQSPAYRRAELAGLTEECGDFVAETVNS